MLKAFAILVFVVFMQQVQSQSTSKIYLIRHAKVDIEKPGWGTSKSAADYKQEYNRFPVESFNPEKVLQIIENHETIDTVFCSPLNRAIQTASLIFGEDAILITDSILAELDYPVVEFPIVQLPVKVWLFISRVAWMTGIMGKEDDDYPHRKRELQIYSQKLVKNADRNEVTVVVAHGMVNRELIKILKAQGWKPENNLSFTNLSVNCLEK